MLSEDIFGKAIKYRGLNMTLPLVGPHQTDNLSVTFAIVDVLRRKGFEIPDEAVCAGVGKTTLPARTEVLCGAGL